MNALDRPTRGIVPGLRMIGAAIALALALGACSASTASLSPTASSIGPVDSSGPAAPGAAEPSSAVCQDVEATKAAIKSLTTLDVKAAGADGVKAAITTVRTSLDTLKASAGADLAPSITAVTTAVDTLQTTVDGANGDMATSAAPIGQAVLGVAAAVAALQVSAKSVCG